MFFVLLGLVICTAFVIGLYKTKCLNIFFSTFVLLILFLFIVFGIYGECGHEEFVKADEIPIYQYSESDKYVKVSDEKYYFMLNKSEDYDVEYDSLEGWNVLKEKTTIYEQESIEKPIIVKYTAKRVKNFFTFGLGPDYEKYKIYIPKGTIGIK